MKPQIVFDDWWMVGDGHETVYIPIDLVRDNPSPINFVPFLNSGHPPHPYAYKIVQGYGARMSAPGYLDCTPWVVFEFEPDAKAYLRKNYDAEI